MAETKTKRNGRRSDRRGDFHIRSEPIVRTAEGASPDALERLSLPRIYDHPILFAIAQDQHTIFVSWNIDWRWVLGTAAPTTQQVCLRLVTSDGLEQKQIAIEPMAAMQYVAVCGKHDSYSAEIGYYHPADTWHSVATSDAIKLPSQVTAETAAMDLATIPFHLSFQKLLDAFGATNDTPLARAMSTIQKRVLQNPTPNGASLAEKDILHNMDLSLPDIADAHRDFGTTGTKKLARQRALLRYMPSSPSRGFQARWT